MLCISEFYVTQYFYFITECSIIPFVSSSTALDTLEKIPSVFLPLQGQIIYPSKELFLGDGKNCYNGRNN